MTTTEKATEIASDMMEQIQPVAEEVTTKLSEMSSKLSDFTSRLELGPKLTELEEETRTMIRRQPVVAVLAALGVGYLIARLASSRAVR
mgnify:CR=1 FL=1